MPVENVFVYGSLKRGFCNHHMMAGAKFLGDGVTPPNFVMIDLGRYPGVIHGGTVIAGEVFAVPTRLIGRLDRLEENGRLYQREMTAIAMAAGQVSAWIYIYRLARRHARTVRPHHGIALWRANRDGRS